MSSSKRPSYFAPRVWLRLSFVAWLWVLMSSPAFAAALNAGIAVRNVTPNPLLPVSGGVGPSNPVTNKLGELTVRALVLEQQGLRVAVVSCDFLGFPSTLGNRVRAKLPEFEPENILIGATHTHSAPDCYGFPDGKGGFACSLDYVAEVCQKMVDAIREASSNAQPVSVKIASGAAKGKIAYNYYAEQLYDPRCHVLQFINRAGSPVATLVNYAIHPEVLGSERGVCSPDLIGPLYDRIQEQGGGIGIFLNSAQGGMVTADNRLPGGKEARDWAECQRIGTLLADEALRLIKAAPPQSEPALFCAAKAISFPVDSEMLRQITRLSPLGQKLSADHRLTTQLNLLNIGTAQILTIPGEALPNIGFYLKRKMHGEHNLLFGLTNDGLGYMLTKVDWNSFKRYDYVSRTCLGEMTGEILMEEALKLVEQCPRPIASKP